jgi:hypothetical protein
VILEKKGRLSYKLKLPATWRRTHPVFNEVFLTPYKPAEFPSQKKPPPPPPILVNEEEEYVVEELMDSKYTRGKLKYLVQWEGYPNRMDWTWEPEDKFVQAIKDEFHKKHPSAPRRIDIRQMHFTERKTDYEPQQQRWLEGRLESRQPIDARRDAVIPISPNLIAEMEMQKETAVTSNRQMDEVQRVWLMNKSTRRITHHAEVRPAQREGRKYKYALKNLYILKEPMKTMDPHLLAE